MAEVIDVTGNVRECCPNCGSTDLAVSNGVYNSGCGCLGLLLFGWLGLLLGLLGMTQQELVCKHCGSRWPIGQPHNARRNQGCGCMFILLVIVIIIMLVGCAVSNTSAGSAVSPCRSWIYANNDSAALLTISANGEISGHGGVNRYFGKLNDEFENGKFVMVHPIGSTRMTGPNLADEQNFFQLLHKADSWRINKDKNLELLHSGKVIAVLKPYQAEGK